MINLLIHALWVGPVLFLSSRLDARLLAMRFFRDLSRSKARKRLHGNKHALVPMLLGMEKPYIMKTESDLEIEESMTLTIEELSAYNGKDGSPLYLSISGRVYDVSSGTKYYGEGGSYHGFVGKDATFAFATGCLQDECFKSSTEGLNEKEIKETNRWIELYDNHDKYKFVGNIIADPVDEILNREEKLSSELN